MSQTRISSTGGGRRRADSGVLNGFVRRRSLDLPPRIFSWEMRLGCTGRQVCYDTSSEQPCSAVLPSRARSRLDAAVMHVDSKAKGACDIDLQAVAYIVRPNAPTMEAIRALRMDTSLQQVHATLDHSTLLATSNRTRAAWTTWWAACMCSSVETSHSIKHNVHVIMPR